MRILILIWALGFAGSAWAVQPGLGFGENPRLDELFAELQGEDGKQAKTAEAEVQRIFRQSGSAAMDLLLHRGYDALGVDDFDMAIWHFSALIDHAPEFAEGYNGRAVAYFMKGRLGEAIADVEMALTLNPRNFGALAGLGAINEETGNPEAALVAYKAALALNPHSTDIAESVKRVEDQLSVLH